MINKIKKLLKVDFIRNVVTLITGTALAQAIPVAISPILTRIYTPEDFGTFAMYLSISSILSVIVTGRYELAIVLPKKDSDAINIVALSALITLTISTFVFVVVVFFNKPLTSLLKTPEISKWLYFIPLTIFISGMYQCLYYWNNRNKKYLDLSKSRVISTGTNSVINFGFGFLKLGTIGLVFGNIIGQFLATCFLAVKSFKENTRGILKQVSFAGMLKMSKRYKDFLKFDTIAAFFNLSSNQSTHMFFNILFGSIISGYFYLTQKILGIPITLISTAVQDVFKIEMIKLYNENGNTRKLFVNTVIKLAALSIIPSVLIYFYSIELFMFFFGENWKMSGEFIKIMTPVFFLRFIATPLSFMLYIAEKQLYNTIGQAILFLLVLGSFYIGQKYEDSYFTVELLTISYSLFYAAYLLGSYYLTNNGSLNEINQT